MDERQMLEKLLKLFYKYADDSFYVSEEDMKFIAQVVMRVDGIDYAED